MACNCKKNVNPKYADDADNLEESRMNGIEKIGNAFLQILFGLLIGVIMIIGIIPVMAIVTFNMCIGKQTHFKIPNLQKFLKTNK